MNNEIATPCGLAMTRCGVKIFNAFVLIGMRQAKQKNGAIP